MTTTEFDNWFVGPLTTLNANQHGAFASLMIALPLSERYLREKSGCHESQLNCCFYREFVKIFPELTVDLAEKFWHTYRNGLLHQATFSKQKVNRNGVVTMMPQAWISSKLSNTPNIINYDPVGYTFVLLAKEFSEKVISVIRTDFQTFLGPGSVNHPAPTVEYPDPWPTSIKKSGSVDFGPPPSGVP